MHAPVVALILAVIPSALLLSVGGARAFPPDAKRDKPCGECHSLSTPEAEQLLKGLVDRVVDVRVGPVAGVFEVAVQKQNQKIPVYIDFSKKYIVSGNIIEIATRENLTMQRAIDLNRVDISSIPLDDAIVLGDGAAKTKIIVFDDPECPFCKKLHEEMKKVVADNKDIAFQIKMLPLKIHPNAREKAKAIICEKSAQMLDDSLADKPIPKPSCETDQVEKNEAVAERLGIRSTPTLIFPDGRVMPGFKTAEKILAHLKEESAPSEQKAAK